MSEANKLTLDTEQTFKSGLRHLVCDALEAGGRNTIKNCTLMTPAGVKVTFDIVIEVNEVEVENSTETVMTADQVRGGRS